MNLIEDKIKKMKARNGLIDVKLEPTVHDTHVTSADSDKGLDLNYHVKREIYPTEDTEDTEENHKPIVRTNVRKVEKIKKIKKEKKIIKEKRKNAVLKTITKGHKWINKQLGKDMIHLKASDLTAENTLLKCHPTDPYIIFCICTKKERERNIYKYDLISHVANQYIDILSAMESLNVDEASALNLLYKLKSGELNYESDFIAKHKKLFPPKKPTNKKKVIEVIDLEPNSDVHILIAQLFTKKIEMIKNRLEAVKCELEIQTTKYKFKKNNVKNMSLGECLAVLNEDFKEINI